ncbi:hypothetical protein C427_5346 [Paraglaciecola psychrophila 170]|uniref:Uncharacterized protein n=1 Tax=Paraglaciecola psychrophila 170 TaxID=1129794 RepID=K6ZXC4_9ALTE|nr:hypothetical protein C427_5346 [Paraglaciecola psychrophila 170]GAC40556.1 hypothetical protein GPSY_4955 [Paraglaciecola psychrophila 170]
MLLAADYLYEVAEKITSNDLKTIKKVGINPTYITDTYNLKAS